MDKMCCSIGKCEKRHGFYVLAFGVLLLLNAQQGWFDNWVAFGGLIAIKGLILTISSSCSQGK